MNKAIFSRVAIVVLCLMTSACSSSNRQYFSIYLHNDTSKDIYEPEVIADNGRYLLSRAMKSIPLISKSSTNANMISIKEFPNYLTVRWKRSINGEWIERQIAIREELGMKFKGTTYVSIVENDELRLSWVAQGKKWVAVGCGGYIFETYYDRAKPEIERNIRQWKAYLAKKEADLAQGNTEPYRTGKYYDTVKEVQFRCNDILYMN